MAQALTTRDLGLAIRDHIEDHDVVSIDDEGERTVLAGGLPDVVEFVDCSDADNLIVQMLGGQRFAIRITAI